jgi:BlaI family transcriptional regulator, penicillinase repressor
MPNTHESSLSRRERQIMDVIYARGEASVAQVHAAIADRPSYSSIRALMRILEEKGHLRHKLKGRLYVFAPVRSRQTASRSAAKRLLDTFFGGSAERAMAALLEASDIKLSARDLERLAEIIAKARQEGR